MTSKDITRREALRDTATAAAVAATASLIPQQITASADLNIGAVP